MKRLLIVCLGSLALASRRAAAPAPSIDAFFETFTADWVRMSPNQGDRDALFHRPRTGRRAFTSTTLGAQEIHQIGLREVARLEGEMDAIFRRLGRTKESITARVAQREKDLAYPITDVGREAIIATSTASCGTRSSGR